MSQSVAETVAEWSAEGRRIALATLVDVSRSAPKPIGTKMAVDDLGRVSGGISGGCVEGAVVQLADEILNRGEPRLQRYGIADELAWNVGLPCGGEIDVWVERFRPDGLQADFFRSQLSDLSAVLVTALEGPSRAAKLLVRHDGRSRGSLGSERLDLAALALGRDALGSERSEPTVLDGIECRVFVDVATPQPRLVIVGAVDLAAQLSTIAKLAGWRPTVIDPRRRFATRERFPDAERVIAGWPQAVFPQLAPLDRATAIVVLTHDPKIDDAALTFAMRSDAGYIGAMGSRTTHERRRARLIEAGFSPADVNRISGPIGLDLGASSPGETAISIMAEIVARRNGRAGGRLTNARGPIHSAPHTPRRERSDVRADG